MKFFVLILLIFISIQWSLSKKTEGLSKKIFIPPVKKIKDYSFGYSDVIASLLWVRVIQDLEVCDQRSELVDYPQLVDGENPIEEILSRKMPVSRCNEGWVYQMLDTISDLEPQFKAVYQDGGVFLSVLVDDREGAQKIFTKGRGYFPDDWELYYRSAYHELFEMQNPAKAAELLRKAGERGAPKLVYSLSAKLYTRLGQATFIKPILESVLARDPRGNFSGRIRMQLDKINETLRKGQ